tara:strand:+ start:231 stop:590 length:360 start_codon:yes stop_codon:yes gene_type:complete
MIDTDKYEGHDLAKGRVGSDYNIYDRKGNIIFDADDVGSNMATLNLLADAPLLLEEVKRLRNLVCWLRTTLEGSQPLHTVDGATHTQLTIAIPHADFFARKEMKDAWDIVMQLTGDEEE